MAFEDGYYTDVAINIAKTIQKNIRANQIRPNYAIAVLDQLATKLSIYPSVTIQLIKYLREVCICLKYHEKVRSTYRREISEHENGFDICWDEYKLWEKSLGGNWS